MKTNTNVGSNTNFPLEFTKKYDRIYTVGCFDWFHYGHETLFRCMKNLGTTIIAGVHDDNSIRQLKGLCVNEHQQLIERMKNVKKFADVVYVIPDQNPTYFLECILRDDDNKNTACFVRADDMPNFPGRHFIESKISIKFIPYTQGISSTQIRKTNKKHIQHKDKKIEK